MVHRTPNFAQGDSARVVMDLLGEFPEGLTMAQLRTLVVGRGLMPDVADPDTRALYFRLKRAVESLEELGYLERGERRATEGFVHRLVPVEPEALKKGLKETLLGMKGRLPSDGDLLLAAFEGVLEEIAEELGLEGVPKVGRLAKTLKKGTK